MVMTLNDLGELAGELGTRPDLHDTFTATEGRDGAAAAVRLLVEVESAWREALAYLRVTPGGGDYPNEPERGRPVTGIIQAVRDSLTATIDFRTQNRGWREAFAPHLRQAVKSGQLHVSDALAKRWEIKL
jgi:hypothetical protein